MAIGSAIQRGTTVYVQDEKGRRLATIDCGAGPNDGLKGFTGSTVCVQRGTTLHVYNENGYPISTVSI